MAVSRVDYGGETLIDISGDTVAPETLLKGITATNSAGEKIEGEFDADIFQTKEDETLATEDKTVVGAINGINTNVAKLLEWYNKENYVEMVASIKPKSSTYELGMTKDITFTWSFKLGTGTDAPKATLSSLKFRGNTITDLSKTSETVTGITSTSSYYIEGTRADGNKETVGDTASVYFYNRYYFGCAPKPEIPENSTEEERNVIYSNFIKGVGDYAGLKEDWGYISQHKSFTKTPNCPDDSYIWYAYPTRYGLSTFKMNGLPADFNVQTIYFTNSSGYKENYYLYQSIEPSLGSIEVQIL
jgi:hypothetical protein